MKTTVILMKFFNPPIDSGGTRGTPLAAFTAEIKALLPNERVELAALALAEMKKAGQVEATEIVEPS